MSIATGSRHVHVAGRSPATATAIASRPETSPVRSLRLSATPHAGLPVPERVSPTWCGSGSSPRSGIPTRWMTSWRHPERGRGARDPQPLPPLSFIGVDYLFEPDVLIEVEAYAVID
ncbi:hypothetical protein NKG05_10735 [Oerskovia sp. M15]